MSLSLLSDILEDTLSRRGSRFVDQHFGCGLDLDDMLEPLTIPKMLMRGRYYRPWRSAIAKKDSGSIISKDKDQFQVSLDVQQFAPEEITVKTVDNAIVVEGKHEEKEDEHGYVSRHFVRRYTLPDGHDIKNIKSSLSSDGVLTVQAPKRKLSDLEETVIPIEYTGPVKPLENHDRKKRRIDNK